MTKTDVRREIKEALEALLGEKLDGKFSDSLNPIRDLKMESIQGIDLAVDLEVRLGINLENKVNPLVDDEGKRGRTIAEMTDYLVALVGAAVVAA